MGLRNSIYSSLSLAIVLLLALGSTALAKPPSDEVIRLLPKELGGFRLVGVVRPSETLVREGLLGPQAAGQKLEADRHYSVAEAEYVSSENSRLLVEVVRFPRDSDAYSLLTIAARSARDPARVRTRPDHQRGGNSLRNLAGPHRLLQGHNIRASDCYGACRPRPEQRSLR